MVHLIDKDALVAEIKRRIKSLHQVNSPREQAVLYECKDILSFLDSLEVKEVDLIIHTIIAECCDWLVMNTNLSHDKIESCRNLMLTVKEEQFKARKGEKV